MSERVLNFINWFRIFNSDHLKAYRTLLNTGSWPEGFIPTNVVMNEGWNNDLYDILDDDWDKYIIEE